MKATRETEMWTIFDTENLLCCLAPDPQWVVPIRKKVTERYDENGNLIERIIEDE